MSTTASPRLDDLVAAPDDALDLPSRDTDWQLSEPVRQALKPLASLKLTVVLFAMSIFIVLAGTLAQVNHDIWEVIDLYFRVNPADIARDGFPWFNFNALFAWVDFQ